MPPAAVPRLAVVDAVRGIAIIGVMAFHLVWDLFYFGYYDVDVMTDLGWVIFARTLSSTFLFLVGFNLVLAHGRGWRWSAFWRRFAVIAGASLVVTIATWVLFPESFIFFGILHAIALFTLLALPALRAPLWLVVLVALAVLVPGFAFHHPAFDDKALAWIGFWVTPPPANDLVPIFPWFGMTLAGVVAARLVLASPLVERLAALPLEGLFWRVLRWLGRWSLPVYLVHQPILVGIFYGIALLTGPIGSIQGQAFLRSCESSCSGQGYGPGFCTAYCSCALDVVETNALWPALDGTPDPDEQAQLDALSGQCTAAAFSADPTLSPEHQP